MISCAVRLCYRTCKNRFSHDTAQMKSAFTVWPKSHAHGFQLIYYINFKAKPILVLSSGTA